jgi:hypothetical protein
MQVIARAPADPEGCSGKFRRLNLLASGLQGEFGDDHERHNGLI